MSGIFVGLVVSHSFQTGVAVKRFSEDPNAPLTNPPKNVKAKRNVPEKTTDSSVRAYNLYVGDDNLPLQEIGETAAKRSKPASVNSVETYSSSNYKSQDAETLRARLGLTNADTESGYLTAEAWKVKKSEQDLSGGALKAFCVEYVRVCTRAWVPVAGQNASTTRAASSGCQNRRLVLIKTHRLRARLSAGVRIVT